MFENHTQALTEALFLAVTAPTRRQSYRALTTAEYLASQMSESEIETAKATAEARLNAHNN